MNRRSLARRLRRIERGRIGWTFTTVRYTDEHGEKWEKHVATNPRGVVRYFEAPPLCETEEEWLAFIVRRGFAAAPPPPITNTSTAAGVAAGGVLSIPENVSGGTSLH